MGNNMSLCVVVAAKDIKDAKKSIKEAKNWVNLIEWRLDFLEKIEVTMIRKVLQEMDSNFILTLRKPKEGGKFKGDEKLRIKMIRSLLQIEPEYIDLELSINKKILENLIDSSRENDVKVLLTSHDFNKTPTFDDLLGIWSKALAFSPDIIKIVTYARKIEDNLNTLKLDSFSNRAGKKTISFCMGKKGIISRTLCPFFGSPFSYASLREQVAPGQIDIEKHLKVIDLIDELVGA